MMCKTSKMLEQILRWLGQLLIYIKIKFVCLCPINVKTAKPIRPKFCVGPHVAPGKVYE